MKILTTSWDDGHVLDFRLAELLNQYNLPGTFYIPKRNAEHEVMLPEQVVELSKGFEIGGHTINHIRLHSKDETFLQNEIGGCYQWLSDLLGEAPQAFCFPGGVFHQKAADVVFQTGFTMARTTELLSTQIINKNKLTPTTLQVFEHNAFTYAKHLLKRARGLHLMQWLSSSSLQKLEGLTESYLNNIERSGGCFHLWGHSWEIEEFDLWGKLEELFRILSRRTDFSYVPNSGLVNHQQTRVQPQSAFL